jgi:hypothetical protein
MKYEELNLASSAPWAATHPHVAEIVMDPVRWSHFEQTFDARPEVRILATERSRPDLWTVYAACASKEIKDQLESNW